MIDRSLARYTNANGNSTARASTAKYVGVSGAVRILDVAVEKVTCATPDA